MALIGHVRSVGSPVDLTPTFSIHPWQPSFHDHSLGAMATNYEEPVDTPVSMTQSLIELLPNDDVSDEDILDIIRHEVPASNKTSQESYNLHV